MVQPLKRSEAGKKNRLPASHEAEKSICMGVEAFPELLPLALLTAFRGFWWWHRILELFSQGVGQFDPGHVGKLVQSRQYLGDIGQPVRGGRATTVTVASTVHNHDLVKMDLGNGLGLQFGNFR